MRKLTAINIKVFFPFLVHYVYDNNKLAGIVYISYILSLCNGSANTSDMYTIFAFCSGLFALLRIRIRILFILDFRIGSGHINILQKLDKVTTINSKYIKNRN